MPALLPRDTRAALPDPETQVAHRGLLLDRFADPTAKEEARERFLQAVVGKTASGAKRDAWRRVLLLGLRFRPEDLVFGRLEARLLVNLSGGVMENSGLCLDRLSGLPFVPGSAVKGCTRRTALRLLFEAKTTEARLDLLARIASVFGWAETEWSEDVDSEGYPASDLRWACQEDWDRIRIEVQRRLFGERFPDRPFGPDAWRGLLASAAGRVDFLASFPWQSPSPDLELEVLTCHHPRYYAEGGRSGEATDTEDPIPVVFPAVAPGHVFAFALRSSDAEATRSARDWLRIGLSDFGLGAKTAAGYGWFETGDALQAEKRAEATRWLAAETARDDDDRKRRETEDRLGRWGSGVAKAFGELSAMDPTKFATAVLEAASTTNLDRKRAVLLCISERKENRDAFKAWTKSDKENNRKRVEILRAIATETGMTLP